MSQEVNVTGPLGDRILAKYYILCKPESHAQYGEDMERKEDKIYSSVQHKIAIIEMSSAAGLPLVPEDKRNPLHTTTYGVGEMIRDAIGKGCRDFIIGIGGSATNDGGIGMLQALGYRFVDTDIVIQEQEKRLLKDIIADEGVDGFIDIENRVNASIIADKSVIASNLFNSNLLK